MIGLTLPHLVSMLAEEAGTRFGHLAARHPRVAYRALRLMERAGVRQAGWALLFLEIGFGREGGAQ